MSESPKFIELLVGLYKNEKNSEYPRGYIQPLKELLSFYKVDIEE